MRRGFGLWVAAAAAIAACSNVSRGTGDGPDPELSRSWTWAACGTLAAAAPAVAALFSPDGASLAVADEAGEITLYDVSGAAPPARLRAAGAAPAGGKIVFAPDGTLLLATTAPGAGMTLWRVSDGAVVQRLAVPPGFNCGAQTVRFSAAGARFIAYGLGPVCVWNVSDGTLAGTLSGAPADATVRGDTIVALYGDGYSEQLDVTTYDLSGQPLGQVTLSPPYDPGSSPMLSPAGDRVAIGGSPTALWDADSGLPLVTVDQPAIGEAVFDATGDLVLVGDGVYRAADGTRLRPVATPNDIYDTRALAPDGTSAAVVVGWNAGLIDLSSPAKVRYLGRPARDPNRTDNSVSALAISADGRTLGTLIEGPPAYALRLGERLEDALILAIAGGVGESMTADVSMDGTRIAVSGDNRSVTDVITQQGLWDPPAPGSYLCPGTQLRFSSTGRWVAGAGYDGLMGVFDASPGGSFGSVAAFPAGCHEAAAFSRDDGLMATSEPVLYRTGAAAADWKAVWGQPRPRAAPGPGVDLGWSAWGNDVRFSPDGMALLVSRCADWTCDAGLYAVDGGARVRSLPDLTAPHPSFSPEGQWIVAGGTLLHLPSSSVRPLDPGNAISTAVFTPGGDIIAGTTDGTLIEYCRSP